MKQETEVIVLKELLGQLDEGRNEPALHHYHNTFRAALNLPPLQRLD